MHIFKEKLMQVLLLNYNLPFTCRCLTVTSRDEPKLFFCANQHYATNAVD